MLEGSTDVCVLVKMESVGGACSSEILSLPEEGVLAVCLFYESCASVLLKSALDQGSLCGQLWQCPVCLSVSVCLWGVCSALLPAETTKEKVANVSLWDPGSPGTGLGPKGLSGALLGWSRWRM